ncbi:SGNH/GDSL hydrolase family protein [Actinoplanes derwentensis]|uniref:Lysophospholipase L1 n=1 Tax=Actinoplanes derwentensis TaxID=113562 RepID=A0A1H1ZMC4_9ACTN|nr:SGNH/GDSL hydrolase family protein [Actinoplanes derwentensis]GID82517.1 SGNH hydrolase [Actinoplanes derwentensis]SDT34858.1 Lysophospholipase L1 [Actinoplanes derwentensis]
MNPLLLPVVAAQGLWLKSTIKPLPAPGGVSGGTVTGSDVARLRLAVVGESTAAGCGVARHEDGFAGAFAGEVAARTGQTVEWAATGRYGATARLIRERLLPSIGDDLNLVVVLAGVNDVLTGRSARQWRADLTGIIGDLAGRTRKIVVTGVPPFTLFPALPAVLARYLAERASVLDQVSEQVCGRDAVFVRSDFDTVPPGFFAADRFHPSAAGYRQWAAMVAERVAQ